MHDALMRFVQRGKKKEKATLGSNGRNVALRGGEVAWGMHALQATAEKELGNAVGNEGCRDSIAR